MRQKARQEIAILKDQAIATGTRRDPDYIDSGAITRRASKQQQQEQQQEQQQDD